MESTVEHEQITHTLIDVPDGVLCGRERETIKHIICGLSAFRRSRANVYTNETIQPEEICKATKRSSTIEIVTLGKRALIETWKSVQFQVPISESLLYLRKFSKSVSQKIGFSD